VLEAGGDQKVLARAKTLLDRAEQANRP